METQNSAMLAAILSADPCFHPSLGNPKAATLGWTHGHYVLRLMYIEIENLKKEKKKIRYALWNSFRYDTEKEI